MKSKGIHVQVGRQGEEIAANYLELKGYQEVARNWSCAIGELDLIFWDQNELVFVEVKTRRESRTAERYLFDVVDWKKRRQLRRLVNSYLYCHFGRKVPKHRIDVVGVIIKKQVGEAARIRHLLGVIGNND